MTCLHPFKAFDTGLRTENGKRSLIFSKIRSALLPLSQVSKSLPDDYVPDWNYVISHNGHLYFNKSIDLPCGRCTACRLEYSKNWAIRLMMEKEKYQDDECQFLTLTYDDEHLPVDNKVNKPDVQDFIKRLRYHYPQKHLVYYLAAEYGQENHRPHYHMIVFGLKLDDKLRLTKDLFRSPKLSNVWSKGFVSIGQVNDKSTAYVARYVMKKIYGPDATDEFCLMSKGIGRDYYEENRDKIDANDAVYINFRDRAKQKVPVYFDKLMEKDGFDVESKKAKRQRVAEIVSTSELVRTGLNFEAYTRQKEETVKHKASLLRRSI